MKEMLAGFAPTEVDELFETKGLDYLDREKAKRMAVQQAHHLAHEKYDPEQVYQDGDETLSRAETHRGRISVQNCFI